MREKTLVILAAGIGSRFKGGVKQLFSVGPCGESIMEYSIYDALAAGFNRVVFILRREILDQFNQEMGNRIRAFCESRGVEMVCVFQDMNCLPSGYICPEDRVKPWGTGHALLSCKGAIHGGFVVINADDFYGRAAYELMSGFLDSLPEDSEGVYGLAGFLLKNTLSDNGGVTRGVCRADRSGMLVSIRETKNIIKAEDGIFADTAEGMLPLDGNTPVSMNMWAFTPDVLEKLDARFSYFLEKNLNVSNAEFIIPTEIGGMLRSGKTRVHVLKASGSWFGMTYSADIPGVRQTLRSLSDEGVYPVPLLGK